MAEFQSWAATTLDCTPVALFVIDETHTVVHWNKACERISGVSAEEIVGTRDHWRPFYTIRRPMMADIMVDGGGEEEIERRYAGAARRIMLSDEAFEVEDYFPFLRGGRWLAFGAAPLRDENGRVQGAIEVLRDVTERKRAEAASRESERRLTEIIEGSPVPTFVIDAEHRVTQWNKACESIIGVAAADIVGTTDQWRPFYPSPRPVLADLVLSGAQEEHVKRFYDGKYRRSGLSRGAYEAEDFFPHFPGGGRWLVFTAAPLRDAAGRVVGAVETLQDVTERKRYEAELRTQAMHDGLTGLANRSFMMERLERAVVASRDVVEGSGAAVLFIDLDNFKSVNDTLGHDVGDELVRSVAQRLGHCLRDADTVARLGGDEFVVVLSGVLDDDAVASVVRRIHETLAAPFLTCGSELFVTCSIGVALCPRDGTDVGTLLKNADAAMYRAKEKGRNTFEFFRREINDRVSERMLLEGELHGAIERGEMAVHYQPQVDVAAGRVAGAEALLRWTSQKLGPVSPAKFIPVAEECGLIAPLGDWVMRQVCRDARAWIAAGWRNARLSVNLSARQFLQADLYDRIAALALDPDLNGALELHLELTESMVMADPDRAIAIMGALKRLGLKLAVDDFGTGYSSLSHLRQLPLDILKVDKSFVADTARHADGEALAAAIVSIGRALGKTVVAEGVETAEQLEFLRRHGCHEYQGFLYSPAVPADAFLRILERDGRLAAPATAPTGNAALLETAS